MTSWSRIANHAAHAHATIHAVGMVHTLGRRRRSLSGVCARSAWGVDIVLVVHVCLELVSLVAKELECVALDLVGSFLISGNVPLVRSVDGLSTTSWGT
jgi:hypothetical protein